MFQNIWKISISHSRSFLYIIIIVVVEARQRVDKFIHRLDINSMGWERGAARFDRSEIETGTSRYEQRAADGWQWMKFQWGIKSRRKESGWKWIWVWFDDQIFFSLVSAAVSCYYTCRHSTFQRFDISAICWHRDFFTVISPVPSSPSFLSLSYSFFFLANSSLLPSNWTELCCEMWIKYHEKKNSTRFSYFFGILFFISFSLLSASSPRRSFSMPL